MSRNRKQSTWYSTPRAQRHRRGIQLTLSLEAVAALDELAGEGRRSEYVEALILDALGHHRTRVDHPAQPAR